MFGNRVSDLVAQRRILTFDQFGTAAEYVDYLKAYFSPVNAAYRFNAEDAERTAALERDLQDFMARSNEGGTSGDARFSSEYLLVTACRSDSA
ncbi:MAG TPA: hypothetical protein VHH34_09210 [Pseudonocardiaceae bacterium]|nr:hypothetical protein [Pseudonocardiaceae bacterium]